MATDTECRVNVAGGGDETVKTTEWQDKRCIKEWLEEFSSFRASQRQIFF